jgi:probable rRNA maturation factor
MNYKILVKSRYKKPTESHIIKVASEHLKKRKVLAGIFEIELVSRNRIKEINKKFRNLDMPTDVLSFPAAEFPLPTGRQAAIEKLYGTIFLSCDIISSNARSDGKTFQAEFDFILSHGIDHLLGIHHR